MVNEIITDVHVISSVAKRCFLNNFINLKRIQTINKEGHKTWAHRHKT